VITGRVLSGLGVAFLLFSASIKLAAPEPVLTTMAQLGFPPQLLTGLGLLELSCTLLYAIPGTARVGVILLTGYLGGACATHLRLLDPWLTHTLFPIWLGGVLWAGLLLRDPGLRRVLCSLRHRTLAPG
jgi:hypothetical protein